MIGVLLVKKEQFSGTMPVKAFVKIMRCIGRINVSVLKDLMWLMGAVWNALQKLSIHQKINNAYAQIKKNN